MADAAASPEDGEPSGGASRREDADLDTEGPDIVLARYRRRLFQPELERLLADPIDFSLASEFDPLRVRLSSAIDRVEKRTGEVAEEANGAVWVLRMAVALASVLGAVTLFIALGVPQLTLPAFGIAGLELLFIVLATRRMRRHAVDASELLRLRELYRPALEACATAADLRALAERIRSDMRRAWLSPDDAPAA